MEEDKISYGEKAPLAERIGCLIFVAACVAIFILGLVTAIKAVTKIF